MLRASADTLARVCGGTVEFGSADAMASGACIDSRTVEPGCAFFALPGERSDGHDHLAEAIRRGAGVLVVTAHREKLASHVGDALAHGVAVVRVPDALGALQAVASWHRGRLLCPVVGVTGSTGKTGTKDFMRAVLSRRLTVTATSGNRNNELGVPLTLLEAGPETGAVVVEMGMRGEGQIAELCEMARPDMGLVTNVGTSHIELLGSVDAIARAKGELVEAVPADGTVFLNGDDARSGTLAARAAATVVTYGLSEGCEVRADDVALDEMSAPSFRLHTPQGSIGVRLPVPGRHNVYNALAAAAVGLRLALTLDDVAAGLADARMTGMRMEVITTASGVTVVNDAYNASPSSMKAAIDTIDAMHVAGRRVAVLGDMGELGSLAELAHLEIGEYVAASSVDTLVTVGRRARRIADGARVSGMDPGRIRPCATPEEAVEVLDDLLEEGDAVLVKASRMMGLERVVEGVVSPRVG